MKFLIPLLFLVSCTSAQMVQNGSQKSAYAPEDYQTKGIVKYLNDGAKFVVDARREDAFKQMFVACGGSYKITSEYADNQGHNTYKNAMGGYGVVSSQYVYLEYECKAKDVSDNSPKAVASRRMASLEDPNFVSISFALVDNCKTSADCTDGWTCKRINTGKEEIGMCGNHGLWGRLFYK